MPETHEERLNDYPVSLGFGLAQVGEMSTQLYIGKFKTERTLLCIWQWMGAVIWNPPTLYDETSHFIVHSIFVS